MFNFDLFIWIIIIELISVFSVSGVLLFYFGYLRPRKPCALILRKEQDVLAKVTTKYLSLKDDTTGFGSHRYNLDWQKCAYLSNHGKPVLVFIEGSTEPIQYQNPQFDEKHDSGKLELLVGKKTIKQLVEASKQTTPFGFSVVLIILVGIVGFMIGIFVAPYITPHTATKIVAWFSWLKSL